MTLGIGAHVGSGMFWVSILKHMMSDRQKYVIASPLWYSFASALRQCVQNFANRGTTLFVYGHMQQTNDFVRHLNMVIYMLQLDVDVYLIYRILYLYFR